MHKLLDGYGYSLMLCVTPVGSECLPQHCLCRFPILSFNIHLTIVAISQLSEAKFSMYRTYALAPLTPQRKGGTRSNSPQSWGRGELIAGYCVSPDVDISIIRLLVSIGVN